MLPDRRPAVLAAAVLGFVLALLPRAAASLPTVALEVRIVEPRFVDYYGGDLPAVQTALAAYLRGRLAEELRFLRFDAPPGQADATVRLQLGDPGADALREVHLRAAIAGPAVFEPTDHRWLVFPVEAALREPGPPTDFVQEIGAIVVPEDCCETWVVQLFSAVRLADDAHVFFDDRDWLWTFPFRLDELQADRQTEFVVEAEMRLRRNRHERGYRPLAAGHTSADEARVPERFRERAMARIADAAAAAELQDLDDRANPYWQLRHVGVLRYFLAPPPTRRPTSPSELDLEDGR